MRELTLGCDAPRLLGYLSLRLGDDSLQEIWPYVKAALYWEAPQHREYLLPCTLPTANCPQ